MGKQKTSTIDQLLIYISKKSNSSFGLKDKVFFFRELGFLLQGGVGMIETIDIMKSTTPNFTIKEICDHIHGMLNRGESLSRALSRVPKYFNDADISVIRSGEDSGELVEVLKYIAQEYEFLYEIRNEFINVMIYPMVLMSVSILALYIIFNYVLPQILEIVEGFELESLPLATEMLIAVTNFVTQYGVVVALAMLGIGAIGYIAFLSDGGRRYIDYKIFSIPFFGTLAKYYQMIRFLRFMKLLVFAGMAYNEVFASLKLMMSNTAYKDMIRDISRAIDRGETVTSAMDPYEGSIVPLDVIVLLKVGEETANIANATDNAIWLYKQEFDKMVKNSSKVIEPMMVVLMGGVVGFIAIAVFSVIGSIMGSVQGV